MKVSPTQRTLAAMRKAGWTVQVVEHFNRFVMRRHDLFGGIDVLGIRPGETLGVQATTAANQAARLTKILAEPKLKLWVEAGNRLEIWGWAKRGPRGKRKLWTVSVREVTTGDFR